MSVLSKIFTWWNGATFGTALQVWRRGSAQGKDALGNAYYEMAGGRRWIVYVGANDPSGIPPEYHAWLHHQAPDFPDEAKMRSHDWLRPPAPNATGTAAAFRPAGALEKGGVRRPATGDYIAWTPPSE